MLGPVDYIVLGFKGTNFDGSVLGEISDATKKGVIRVLDLLFILKDEDGEVIEGEYQDQSEELKETFGSFAMAEDLPMLTDEDIEKVAAEMENGTAAAVLIIEHLWAKGLKQAIVDAGGFLIADGRIHSDRAEAAVKDLEISNV